MKVYSWEEAHGWNGGGIVTYDEISQPIRSSHIAKIIIIDEEEMTVKLWGGIGEKKSNGGTQYYLQDRIYDSKGVAQCISTVQPWYVIYDNGREDRRDVQTMAHHEIPEET